MDPLSHVLALSNIDSAVCGELRAGGDWAVIFPGQLHVKFGLVLEGSCWLLVESAASPLRLSSGDCYLVVGGRPYRLASDPDVAPVPSDEIWAPGEELVQCGTGQDTTLIGGRFTFDRANTDLLLQALPPVVHLAADRDETGVLRATMRLIAHETAVSRPGQTLMLDHLARIILMQGLRAQAQRVPSATHPAADSPLLSLIDPRIDAALTAMHADVTRNRPVNELASIAGMSRSAFSETFKSLVGMSPAKYMLSLRMHSAKQILLKTDRTVSSVAAELGYGSEGAFSTAFKRVMGTSPRSYRALGRTGPS
jgi:AraC-like DNA-binding protein